MINGKISVLRRFLACTLITIGNDNKNVLTGSGTAKNKTIGYIVSYTHA